MKEKAVGHKYRSRTGIDKLMVVKKKYKFIGILSLLIVLIGLVIFGLLKFKKPSNEQLLQQVEKIAPDLVIRAELTWQKLYPGDPLRVCVRISSPRAEQEAFKATLMREQGQTSPQPLYTAPKIDSNWVSRVTLNLYRIERDGNHNPVLSASNLAGFLLVPKKKFPQIDLGLGVWFEEWLVPPEVVKLEEGRYVLEVSWMGQGIVDAEFLDSNGLLKGADLIFDVKSPINDLEGAGHARRLAFYTYMTEKYEEARTYGQEALKLDSENLIPECIETYFIVANSSIALKDYKSASKAYRDLLDKLPPSEQNDLTAVVQQLLEIVEQMKEE